MASRKSILRLSFAESSKITPKMESIPLYVHIIFVLTTFFSVFVFYKAAHHSKLFLFVTLLWLALNAALALSGFYEVTRDTPPRFALCVMPPVIFVLSLFFSPAGRRHLNRLDLRYLTLLHIVRIPVEIVLYWLFLSKAVPELMTFSGTNPDIFSGLSAPLVYYFGFARKRLNSKIMLIWNIVCLGFLINIVGHAIFAAPFPFQQLAFEQPNIAVLHFPFVWLPCCIVPLVFLSHLASIKQLIVDMRVREERLKIPL